MDCSIVGSSHTGKLLTVDGFPSGHREEPKKLTQLSKAPDSQKRSASSTYESARAAGRILTPRLTIAELKLLASCALRYNASGVENCGAGSF